MEMRIFEFAIGLGITTLFSLISYIFLTTKRDILKLIANLEKATNDRMGRVEAENSDIVNNYKGEFRTIRSDLKSFNTQVMEKLEAYHQEVNAMSMSLNKLHVEHNIIHGKILKETKE